MDICRLSAHQLWLPAARCCATTLLVVITLRLHEIFRLCMQKRPELPSQCLSAGVLMQPGQSPSPQACLYFFVNRAETDKWFVRMCELRTLAQAATALPHLTVYAASSWLNQLLLVLRQFAATAAAKRSDKAKTVPAASGTQALARSGDPSSRTGHNKGSRSNLTEGGTSKSAPKPVRILRAEGPHEASLPRSVQKLPYHRKGEASGDAGSGSGTPGASAADGASAGSSAGAAASQAARDTAAATNPLQMPKRLLTSTLQLTRALAVALVALNEAAELRRLHRVCVAALTPVCAQLLAASASAKENVDAGQQPLARHDSVHDAGSGAQAAAGEGVHAVASTGQQVSERLLGFVLASALRVEGSFEEAVTLFSDAAAAVIAVGGPVSAEHAAFCRRSAAACYAALSDWSNVPPCALQDRTVVSAGVQQNAALSDMSVWQTPPALTSRADATQNLGADGEPAVMHLGAQLEAGIESADALLKRLYMHHRADVGPVHVQEQSDSILQLGHSLGTVQSALSVCKHSTTPAQASELLAAQHVVTASAQLLIARLPAGFAAPLPRKPLADTLTASNPCSHLLAASQALDCGSSAGMQQALAATAALRIQAIAGDQRLFSGSDSHASRAHAAELPQRMRIFNAAHALASAFEYSVAAGVTAASRLPPKATALQVLLV